MPYVLYREGRKSGNCNLYMRDSDRKILMWHTEDGAHDYNVRCRERGEHQKYIVRMAVSEDYEAINGTSPKSLKKPDYTKFRFVDAEPLKIIGPPMPIQTIKKHSSLVEIFEDYGTNKFAITSRCDSEYEFLLMVSEVLGRMPSANWELRLRNFLPLITDLCCKYRGYKADSVQERKVLIAGDLEAPKTNAHDAV